MLYAGLGNGIVDHPQEIMTYDGGGILKADTYFAYDEIATTGSGATQLVQITGSRGNLTTVRSSTSTTGRLYSTFTYYDTGNVITATDASTSSTTKGPPTTWSYTTKSGSCDYAFPTSVAEPLSLTRSMTWDCNGGVLTSLTDENLQKTSYIFNDPNYWRTTSLQFPDSTSDTATFTYNTTSAPWNVVVSRAMDSARSVAKESVLDGFARVYKQQLTSDPNGTATVDTAYDAVGRVASVSNPYYHATDQTYGITQYAYDALNRTTTVTNPGNSQKQLTYTKRAVQVADEGNNSGGTTHITRVYQVDGLGRPTSVCEVSSAALQGTGGTPVPCGQDISATGFLTTYQYDGLGNITSVSQPGVNGRSFLYDDLSRLTQEINPESGTTTYTYDTGSAGDLYQRTRPKQNQTGSATVVTTYTFDVLHRLTNKTYSDATPGVGYYYDQISPWGLTVQNTKGRVSQTIADGGAVGSAFSYDYMGRIISEWQCTPLNCGTSAFNLALQYDYLGDTTSLVNQEESATYTYSYDTAARLTKLQSSLSDSNHPGTLLTVNTYNALGEVQQATLGNGVVRSLQYDNRGRVTSLTDGSIYSFSLGYAPDSNTLTGNDSLNGNWTYTSDAMGRIATSSQSGQAFSYNYDPSGNRWKQNVTAGSGPSPQYSFDANNHIVGYSYDAAGNLLNDTFHSYTYDAEGRLLTVDGTAASYVYDAFGQRVRSTVGSTAHEFIYNGGRRVDEVTGSTWTWGHPAGAQGLMYTNGSTYFDHTDWLGTVRARSNVSGARTETCTSLAFGDNQSCTGTDESPQHFASLEWDAESSLQYAWFRQLSTTQGRWATPDPSGLAAVDPTNPQSWNHYAYAVNNPIGYVDPLGLNYVLICTPVADGGQYCDWYDDGSGGGTPPPNSGGRSGGGGPANNGCITPSKVQSAVIPVAAAAAKFWNKTVLWGLGGSAGIGFGKGLGMYGTGSVQIAVSPSGNAAYVITAAAPAVVSGTGTYMWVTPSTKGAGILGGSQFGFSNATDPSQLAGPGVDASGSLAAGLGIGADSSLSIGGNFPYVFNVTLGFGAGGRGSAGAATNTTVVPICHN